MKYVITKGVYEIDEIKGYFDNIEEAKDYCSIINAISETSDYYVCSMENLKEEYDKIKDMKNKIIKVSLGTYSKYDGKFESEIVENRNLILNNTLPKIIYHEENGDYEIFSLHIQEDDELVEEIAKKLCDNEDLSNYNCEITVMNTRREFMDKYISIITGKVNIV